MSTPAKRINGYSYVRAIAAFAIVLIHTVSGIASTFDSCLTVQGQVVYYSLQNNLMWAVPCFLMVSGALLLNPNREISIKKVYTVYILRMVLALFIFGMVYYFHEVIFEGLAFSLAGMGNELYRIFAGDTWNHMWYLYCMIGIYMLLPVFRMMTKDATEGQMRYLLLILFIMRSLVALLSMFGIKCGLYLHAGTIYPFYFFLGYYLRRYKKDHTTWLNLLCVLFATVMIVIANFLRYNYNLSALSHLYSYSSVLVIIQTTGIFGLLVNLKLDKIGFLKKILLKLDEQSFGVYLIHLLPIRLLCITLNFNALRYGGTAMLLLIAVVLTIFSAVVTWLLKKIPGVKKLL